MSTKIVNALLQIFILILSILIIYLALSLYSDIIANPDNFIYDGIAYGRLFYEVKLHPYVILLVESIRSLPALFSSYY